MTRRVSLPPEVPLMAARGRGWAQWVDGLGALLAGLLDDWALVVDGPAGHGRCSVVVPVVADGTRAALKVGYPEVDSEHEHLALQRWQGDGAVRLLRADPHRRALLLERLAMTDLRALDDLAACEVVAGLYPRLHRPAPPQLRTLSGRAHAWGDRLRALPRGAPLPHRLVAQAQSLAGRLAEDPATDAVLVHTDLHYGNVLAGDREPWLAIDPKPLRGDPHVEVAPMLWNRWEEVVASGNVREAVRRRFLTIVDAALLDEDRARAWVVVREVVNAAEELDEPRPDAGWITASIAIAKAVQG